MKFDIHINKPAASIEWNKQLNAWTIWQYPTVVKTLKDSRFSAITTQVKTETEAKDSSCPNLPPYRSQFSQIIQKKSAWIKTQMIKTANNTCKKLESISHFDLHQDLILPWCRETILQLAGIEAQTQSIESLFQYAKKVFYLTNGNNELQNNQATTALSHYFLQLLSTRRPSPKEDLISTLAKNTEAPYIFLSPILQLFVGFSTSLPLLLSNSMLALLTQTQNAQKFILNPHKYAHELIRYAGPAQFVYRTVLSDLEIRNHHFKRGDRVALLLSHANRDESVFEAPNSLNFNRTQTATHLSFGRGTHACLGSPLIREACTILLPTILKQFPNLEVEQDKVSWGGSRAIWGVNSLPVKQGKN